MKIADDEWCEKGFHRLNHPKKCKCGKFQRYLFSLQCSEKGCLICNGEAQEKAHSKPLLKKEKK